jgi:hypothetical protein
MAGGDLSELHDRSLGIEIAAALLAWRSGQPAQVVAHLDLLEEMGACPLPLGVLQALALTELGEETRAREVLQRVERDLATHSSRSEEAAATRALLKVVRAWLPGGGSSMAERGEMLALVMRHFPKLPT